VQLNHYRGGRGQPLVLMHGIGLRWQVFEPLLPRLEAEREVIALDLPGFGASPMPSPGTPPGARSLAWLVAEFLEEIGVEKPHVAGNSLGGWVSLELAKHGRVRSATGLSPAGFHNDRERIFQRASLQATKRGSRLIAPYADRLMRARMARAIVSFQYVGHPTRMSAEESAANIRAVAQAAWFDETLRAITSERFSGGQQIDVPVTIAWGESDRLLLPRQARRAQRAIPSARVVMLRGCGHVPIPDDPEQVARVLLEGSTASASPVRR
jgi:pimeloyl-ACP methyl ester carboxylesterase